MIKVSGYKYEYKEDPPIKISFHTWHYRPNVIVRLDCKGYYGLGEAAPLIQITGDDQNLVINELKNLKSIALDPRTHTPQELHHYLDKLDLKSVTLRTALDFAFHDLKGRVLGTPVWKMFSETITKIPNSVTVYLKETLEETAQEAKRLVAKFPHMKVMKVKLSGEGDFERCQAIKEALKGQDLVFSLDANQGYNDPAVAAKTLNRIIELLGNVLLIEEPCPKGDLDKLKFVKDNIINSLIFADESAVNLADVKKIILHNAAHGINIKLQKAGGIYPGQQIASLASNHGLKLMVGAMIEGPIGMSAGIHFANNLSGLILKDLDTDLDMEDHIDGKIEFFDGIRLPNHSPGFGLNFNQDKIRSLSDKGLLALHPL
ncbi:MAG: enolase C-terminal domain-like protein [Lentisphaerota bacterium]